MSRTVIEERHVEAARRAGACDVGYRAGQSWEAVSRVDALWFERKCPDLAAEIAQAEGKRLAELATAPEGSRPLPDADEGASV